MDYTVGNASIRKGEPSMSTELTTAKPVLVGESNPYGGDPAFALYPAPDGCSGHRLCCLILGMRRAAYLEAFGRVNLCAGPWRARAARDAAKALWDAPSAPRLVLLGAKVSAAFQVPFVPFEISEGGTMLVLPHPSGLNRMWGEPGAFAKARAAVAAFVPEIAHLIGKGVSPCLPS